ncbi:MAG: hypothetical protein ABFC28_03535 [Rikenellaceae bacterium]
MKKVRILFVLAIMILASSAGNAQGRFGKDSVECLKNLGFYDGYMKQGNFIEAAPCWREAFRLCPPGSIEKLYFDGQKLYKYFIENNKSNPQLKELLIDSLMMMYDLRTEYFPRNAISAQTYKVFDMVNYIGGADKRVFKASEKVIKMAGNKTEPSILVINMQTACKMFTDKQITSDQILDIYSQLTPIIESQAKANIPEADQAKKDIDLLFANSGVASCENIVTMFGPKFKENPNDKELVSRIVRLLNDAECFKTELYINTVEAMYRLEPSYKSALYLYRLYSSRDENQNAIKLLQEAIDSPESNDTEDADMLIEMATYYLTKMDNPARAAETARLAAQKSSAVAGKSNLIMGTIWANQKCGGNEIESRAKYWVAVDYLIRAKAADSSLTEEAERLIRNYSQYFPMQEEAFMYDIIDGSSYTVYCGGMSATTIVRTRK